MVTSPNTITSYITYDEDIKKFIHSGLILSVVKQDFNLVI